MISLRVAIMVHAVRLELANVMKGSTVTIAQVNFITCNWWFADQNLPIKFSFNLVNLCQQGKNYDFLLFIIFQTR